MQVRMPCSPRLGNLGQTAGVHGATCMQFTLAPRLVVTNASDLELELETPDKMPAPKPSDFLASTRLHVS